MKRKQLIFIGMLLLLTIIYQVGIGIEMYNLSKTTAVGVVFSKSSEQTRSGRHEKLYITWEKYGNRPISVGPITYKHTKVGSTYKLNLSGFYSVVLGFTKIGQFPMTPASQVKSLYYLIFNITIITLTIAYGGIFVMRFYRYLGK